MSEDKRPAPFSIESVAGAVRAAAAEEGIEWAPGELEADMAVKAELAPMFVAAAEVEAEPARRDAAEVERAHRLADDVENAVLGLDGPKAKKEPD